MLSACVVLPLHTYNYFSVVSRTGSGRISAVGGNGFAGGGGGRVSIKVFSRRDDTDIFAHGKSNIILRNIFLYVKEVV